MASKRSAYTTVSALRRTGTIGYFAAPPLRLLLYHFMKYEAMQPEAFGSLDFLILSISFCYCPATTDEELA